MKVYTTEDFLTDDRVMQEARQGKVLCTRNGFVIVLWDGEPTPQHVHANLIRPVPPPPKPKRKAGGIPFQKGDDPRRYNLTPEHGRKGYQATLEKYIAEGNGEYHAKRRLNALIRNKEKMANA